ncbi:primosomal protein N' [bacterium]|nr:primosomal protein N' [bacterium]
MKLYIKSMNSTTEKNYVTVIFPHPPAGHFTYFVPEKFRQNIAAGLRVLVPLGRRRVTGFTTTFVNKPDFDTIKSIEDVLDEMPLLTPELIDLTAWIAEYYLGSWGEVIKTALPPGMLKRERLKISLPDEDAVWPKKHIALLELLKSSRSIYADQLKKRLNKSIQRHTLRNLAQAGLISLTSVLEETQARIQMEAHYSLARQVEKAELDILKRKAPRQAYVVESLMGAGYALPRPDLEVTSTILKRLEETGWIAREEHEKIRNPYKHQEIVPAIPLTLTDQQNSALYHITEANKKGEFTTFLLHGVTASGKTQVYIEAIRDVLNRGQSALVLIPEIALTPQAVERYQSAFGDQVAVLHSRMSTGERYDTWRQIKNGRYCIALGPRSAIFAPLVNLGLIIVDEEHDSSYKQIDPAPRYHARDVAVMRGMKSHARIILGSATPSLESYFNATNGKYFLLELKDRIDFVPMPTVHIIDRSKVQPWEEERVFDSRLVVVIKERIDAGEQVILLQNRRGFATFLRCNECGSIEQCPHCDISMTFHQSDRWLRCHYCGHQRRAKEQCSSCGGTTLKYRGIGTQRVEEALQEQLPGIRIIRMDQDTTQHKGAHERLLKSFAMQEADVLIGTQMVAKGHDFPGVHLVGIISADTGLHFPDFRAAEKTFQLLTQTAGRAGRRDKQGHVFIQTRHINHPVLDFSRDHDYNSFYAFEIDARKELGYPPWGRLAMVRFRGIDESLVSRAATLFRQRLAHYQGIDILGPVPSPLARLQNQYRFQVIFRSHKETDPSGQLIRATVREGIKRYRQEGAIQNVKVAVDIDPVDLL